MNLTRERTILLTVLTIGLSGLFVDRLWLGGGSAGPVAASAEAFTPTPPGQDASIIDDEARPPVPASVADRLDAAASRGDSRATPRDAFALVGEWAMQLRSEQADPPMADPVARFKQAHRLNAVMGSGAQGVAIVDGQPVKVGQRVDGFTLIGVNERSAAFDSRYGRAVFTLGGDEP